MTTVSKPIYFEQNGNQILLGVVGIDVLYSELISFGDSNTTINNTLFNRGTFITQTISDCDIVNLRG